MTTDPINNVTSGGLTYNSNKAKGDNLVKIANNTYVDKDLYGKYEKHLVNSILTLKDGTKITADFDDWHNEESVMTITKGDNGGIVFYGFDRQWAIIEGTDADDKYVLKNSNSIDISGGKGNDVVYVNNGDYINVYMENDGDMTVVKNSTQTHVSNIKEYYKDIQVKSDGISIFTIKNNKIHEIRSGKAY